ncbi:hypothetical protein RHGRI_009450 [Rhododendron griersonianum]|uniref:DM2 domain-containing protein n=1 Tax=Rhododendron griersonianum TaxID=479676 RepID=A0AAV6KET3_9ERIC|nr:hypothetical protein RHGRI_009450 [Rhododendron griersonianum]
MSERGAATTMVSDQAIAESLESLLRETNPRTTLTSFNSVVQHLESKLGLDLTHKLDFIRNHIHLLFNPNPNPNPNPPPSHHHHHHHHHQNPNFHAAPSQNPNFHGGFRPPQPQPPLPEAKPEPNFHGELGFRPPLVVAKTEPCVSDVTTSGSATTAADPAESPKESSQTGRKRRGGPGGLNKVCGVTPELQVIVGHPELPRTEIVKQLWAYIRKHNLQDPGNKRKIICNDELRLVFETDCTDMFKMNKLLSKHIIPLEPTKPPKKPKMVVEPGTKSSESGGPVVMISEALANFFGIAGREMLHSEVLRRVWEYVTVNHLEDPVNPMVIQCDTKLQELFGCPSISALGIPEMLARHHLFKRS